MADYDLTTKAAVKLRLQIGTAQTGQDDVIDALVSAASKAILAYTDREFAPADASETRVFPVRDCVVDLAPYDLRTVATMTLHPEAPGGGTVLTANSDYALWPLQSPTGTYTQVRLYDGLSLDSTFRERFGFARLQIAGAWGFAAVPADVAEACIMQVAAWFRGGVSVFSQAFNPDEVTFERPEALTTAVRRLLDPYRRSAV